MKRTLFAACLLAVCATMNAQTKTGGITAEMLQKIQTQNKPTAAERALSKAVATNAINDIVKNPNTLGTLDTNFSDETTKQSIHDQKSSGRCWMFSGLNVLRSRFAAAHKDTLAVEYSQAYLFFYDQLEKANMFLQGVIDCAAKPMNDPDVAFLFKSPLSDGGTFCGVADLTEKYGLVPACVMPETYQANSTSVPSKNVKSKLRQFGLELRKMVENKAKATAIQARKTEMLGTIYKMLTILYGEPVKEFTYTHRTKTGKLVGEAKTYTPQSFYAETVGEPLNGSFVMLMNDPRNEYYKLYEVEFDRHTYDGHNWKYINVPMEDIEKCAIASIKENRKMYSSYDVNKQLDRTRGYMSLDNFDYEALFGTDFSMNKAERIATFDSGSTHAMTLTAVDLDKNGKPVKWAVENSWGATSGQKGIYIMTDEWFREYMFRLVVERKYVPENLLKIENTKPVMLKYDDPLFQNEDE